MSRRQPRSIERGCRGGAVLVAVATGPDEVVAAAVLGFDQAGVDRGREARIVQLDAEIFALRLAGDFLPGRAELGGSGEDAKVGTALAVALGGGKLGIDVEGQGLDRAGEAVLGQPSIVLLKRSIGICFVICWRTLRVSFSAIAAPQLERRADVWPLQRDQMRA